MLFQHKFRKHHHHSWHLKLKMWNLGVSSIALSLYSLRNSSTKHFTLFFQEFYLRHVCACVHAQLCPALCDPWTVAHQAALSMEFSRQEYWSGLPFPSPGIFPTQGSNLSLLHLLDWQVDSLPLSHLGSPLYLRWKRPNDELNHLHCKGVK